MERTKKSPEEVHFEAIKALIVSKFTSMNGGQFVGFREYENGNGEIANHVVNANFAYGKAKKEDYEVKLQNMTKENAENVCAVLNKTDFFKENPVTVEEVFAVKEKLYEGYLNPRKRTEKQENSYIPIPGTTLRIFRETGEIHAYALSVSKKILKEGEYKERNSRRNTRIQNVLKKELGFTTIKFRNFIVTPDKVARVALTGDTLQVREDG